MPPHLCLPRPRKKIAALNRTWGWGSRILARYVGVGAGGKQDDAAVIWTVHKTENAVATEG